MNVRLFGSPAVQHSASTNRAPRRVLHKRPPPRADRHVQSSVPKQPAPLAPVRVNGATFPKATLSDLRPGDIGFQVQRHKRDFKQFWITVGGKIAARVRPTHTDAYVVHAFVVVKPHPESMILHTVDGAADNYTGINHLRMNFGTEKFRVVPHARYLFFRANDPGMRARILRVAENWAAPDQHNFSMTSAVASPFHSLRFDRRARDNAQVLANQANVAAPPRRADGKLYKMSCSEFVFNALSAAATSQWRDEHPEAQDTLGDNPQGPFGNEMAQDAKGVHPPQLEATLQHSPHWAPIGYLTEDG